MHSYNFPYSATKDIDNFANIYYRMGREEKEEFIKSLKDEEFHKLYKNSLNSQLEKESIERFKPYHIHLGGNDDCSYSKWFFTEHEMNKELDYLRKMQPLNFWSDILDRGYIFTN